EFPGRLRRRRGCRGHQLAIPLLAMVIINSSPRLTSCKFALKVSACIQKDTGAYLFMAEPTGLEPATSKTPDRSYIFKYQLFTAKRNSGLSAGAGFLTGRNR
ncbi:MAG TPA: hypothetical protein VGC91_11595, partial [Pyrinomonadaceae bacterium]